MMYALGAPLSLHFGSGYDPRMPGSWMQNVVIPESALDAAWTSDAISTESCFGNREDQAVRSVGLLGGEEYAMAYGHFEGGGLDWRRRVVSYAFSAAPTVLRIRDDFGGRAEPRVASLALAATGSVETPSGIQTPPRGGRERPSSGLVVSLGTGVNRFRFRGAWGVDFDVFADSTDERAQAFIGEWGHESAPTREREEFGAATGRSIKEPQNILRLRSTGPFDIVIVPYRAGSPPGDVAVTRTGSTLTLRRNGASTTLTLPSAS
jgi:hypothetical protein